jgi:hypothetical protein
MPRWRRAPPSVVRGTIRSGTWPWDGNPHTWVLQPAGIARFEVSSFRPAAYDARLDHIYTHTSCTYIRAINGHYRLPD